jgi:hypothetical protein
MILAHAAQVANINNAAESKQLQGFVRITKKLISIIMHLDTN